MNNNQDTFILNNKVYSNNNNILLDVINKLENIINDLNNNKQINIIIKQIRNIIIIMNKVVDENKRNNEKIREDIKNLHNDTIEKFQTLNINNNNCAYETVVYNNGKYIGETKNGLKEGKGIYYYNNGDRYEGDWKNDKQEGKGIFYYTNRDKEMGI